MWNVCKCFENAVSLFTTLNVGSNMIDNNNVSLLNIVAEIRDAIC